MKKSKRILSFFLALLMLLTALPFSAATALADSSSVLSPFLFCQVRNKDVSSRSDTGIPMVSDSSSTWFSYAVVGFNISSLDSTENVESAVLSGTFDSISYPSLRTQVEFHLVPNSYLTSNYYVGIDWEGTTSAYRATINTLAPSSTNNPYTEVCTNAGLSSSTLIGTVTLNSSSTSYSLDIASSIASALSNGYSQVKIIAVYKTVNTSSNSSQSTFGIPSLSVKTVEKNVITRNNDENVVTGVTKFTNCIYTYKRENNVNYLYDYGTTIWTASGTDDLTKRLNPSFTYDSSKGTGNLISITCMDDPGASLSYNSWNGVFRLTGTFSNDKYKVSGNTNVFATLKFTYANGQIEYHRVAVKSVPVVAHEAVVGYANNDGRESAFLTRFNDSYGSSLGSDDTSRAGNWNYLDTLTTTYNNTTTLLGNPWSTSNINTSNDKIGGIGICNSGDAVAYPVKATYYIDKSASDTYLGNSHLWNGSSYTINVDIIKFMYNYTTKATNSSYFAITNDGVTPGAGTWTLPSYNINVAKNVNGDTITATYTNNASLSGTTATATTTSNSNVPVNIRISMKSCYRFAVSTAQLVVNLFDKTSVRNTYNSAMSYTKTAVDENGNVVELSCANENYWTATSYATYIQALLNAEAYLTNFENTTVDTSYSTAITNAYQALVPRGNWQLIQDEIDSVDRDLYTLNSLAEFDSKIDALTYYNLTTDEKRDITVDNVKTEINNVKTAENVLDPLADLTKFEESYETADELLTSLNGLTPKYSASEVQALISSLSGDASAYYNSSETDRKNYGTKSGDQDKIDTAQSEIDSAGDSLKNKITEDTVDTFRAAFDLATNYDMDVYTEEAYRQAMENAQLVTTTVTYTNLAGEEVAINCFSDDASDTLLDIITTNILNALNSNIRYYNVSVDGNISSAGGQGVFLTTDQDNVYNASYGTKAVLTSDNADTAWYMEYQSTNTERGRQFQSVGSTFTISVFGALTVQAVQRTDETPNKITIYRQYNGSNAANAMELVDYVGSTYTLPAASAVALYSFSNYTVNGVTKNAGDVITITGDTRIIAEYEYTGAEYTVTATDSSGNQLDVTGSYKYNEKLTVKDSNAVAWLQVNDDGSQRIFFYGSECTLFVAESINLVAVTEIPENISTDPAVYLRSETTFNTDTLQRIFNGQFVAPADVTVTEYGILIGRATENGSLTEDEVVLENTTCDDYKLLRCKASMPTSSNQFTIKVGGSLQSMDGVIYKGYIIYKKGDQIYTYYTDAMYE